jgi:hypothetical protein
MKNLNANHNNKTFSISYDVWQMVRKAAFDREIPIKELVADIITGKTAPLSVRDV